MKLIQGLNHGQYITKHSIIYLPQSGNVNIDCNGHSVCHSMKIFGNTSINTTNSMAMDFHLKTIGLHSFKDSYLSFPSNADIQIICGAPNNDNGACYSASFDGSQSGAYSDINITCNGNDACYNTMIVANELSKSLTIDARNGNNVLSKANVYCPSSHSSMDSNCKISVHGNGSNMLVDTNIYSNYGFDDVNLECDYSTSIQLNCYGDEQSGPTLYCNDIDSCRLVLSDTENKSEWSCYDGLTLCDDIYHHFFTDTKDENYFNDTDGDILESIPMDEEEVINTGLLYNIKGQIALSTIMAILICLFVIFV